MQEKIITNQQWISNKLHYIIVLISVFDLNYSSTNIKYTLQALEADLVSIIPTIFFLFFSNGSPRRVAQSSEESIFCSYSVCRTVKPVFLNRFPPSKHEIQFYNCLSLPRVYRRNNFGTKTVVHIRNSCLYWRLRK